MVVDSNAQMESVFLFSMLEIMGDIVISGLNVQSMNNVLKTNVYLAPAMLIQIVQQITIAQMENAFPTLNLDLPQDIVTHRPHVMRIANVSTKSVCLSSVT